MSHYTTFGLIYTLRSKIDALNLTPIFEGFVILKVNISYQAALSLLFYICTCSAVHAGQYYLKMDNDIIFKEDANYSNGLIFGWESDLLKNDELAVLPVQQWHEKLFFSQPRAQKAWGFKISQRMWTPDEIKIAEAQPYDRPYAGFLEIEYHLAMYSESIAQKSWLSIGVIGPASGTEQLQGAIHKVLGSSTPAGWAYQIENTLTAQLAYEIDYLLLRSNGPLNTEWEISAYNHNALSNVRSEINGGLTFRWGVSLAKSFGRLSNHFAHSGNLLSLAKPHSVLFYTRIKAGYRFNDLTIDGDLPYTSHVEFKPKQMSAILGLSYYFPSVAIDWSFNFYSKEYESDKKVGHGYGSLQISWLM